MKHYLTFFLVLIGSITFSQTTHTVDSSPNSGADYTNLQTAINEAEAGDIIYVHPSPIPYGNITINKLVHLRGLGHYTEYTNGMNAEVGNITLNSPIGADGITISGLNIGDLNVSGSQSYDNLTLSNCKCAKITAGSGAGQCDNWIIIGNVIERSTSGLITKYQSNGWMLVNNHIRQVATSPSWNIFQYFNGSDVVKNNIIVSQQQNDDVVMFYECENLLLENCLILFYQNATGINFSGNSVSFNHCLIYNYLGLEYSDLNGLNNLNNVDPLFVDIGSNPSFGYSKDFHLQETSPAAGHGTDGEDLGLYGSSFEFSTYGQPADLPYPKFMSISNGVVQAGGTLNVVFEAHGN